MTTLDMAGWLEHYFPAIERGRRGAGGCWIGRMKGNTPEHNPPFYWLGLALDAVAGGEDAEVFARRLVAAHSAENCPGADDPEQRDDRAQAVLSEACAYAWTATRLGAARFVAARDSADVEQGPVRLHVAAHRINVAPARIGRDRDLPAILEAALAQVRHAAATLPPTEGRVLYLDTSFEHFYANHVGYALDLTEPVEETLRRACAEAGIGYVLTRPFQWGNAVAASY